LPYEISNIHVQKDDTIACVDVDVDGNDLGLHTVLGARPTKDSNHTWIVRVRMPRAIAKRVVGFTIQDKAVCESATEKIPYDHIQDGEVVCLCERVTAGQIQDLVRQGATDMNQIKAITRAGMGPCGYKTYENLMNQIFMAEKITQEEVVKNVRRPLYIEVPLEKFANGGKS